MEEKMENLTLALIDAMQTVGGKVNLLNSVLIGETTQFDSTTVVEKLIKALNNHTEQMRAHDELIRQYVCSMEAHTKALNENTAAMNRSANAMMYR